MEFLRKPRCFFLEDVSPRSVTFDDGTRWRRNFPWIRYAEATWDYTDPGIIRVEIGDWQVVISGHNLEPLFDAIQAERLQHIRVHPEFAEDPAREGDVFATSIRFVRLSAIGKGALASQLNLQLDA